MLKNDGSTTPMSEELFEGVLRRTFYFIFKHTVRVITSFFCREVTVVGAENIPLYGPVIFVGNHNNKFLDGSILISVIPRKIHFLVAGKSLAKWPLKQAGMLVGYISVQRPRDCIFSGIGSIKWDEDTNVITGIESKFKIDLSDGDSIWYNQEQCVVEEVVSETSLVVANKFAVKCPDAVNGTSFQITQKIDQREVYNEATVCLQNGETIGIFPEGGSHDRTYLMPLKAGVSIMALRSLAQGVEDIMIVPIGLTYFQGHKSTSKATMEIGTPIRVSDDILQKYITNRREAYDHLLNQVEESLRSLIIAAEDWKELKAIRLCASLYPPERLLLSPVKRHALCHIFSRLFKVHRGSDHLRDLKKELDTYYSKLKHYGILDYEIWQLKQSTLDCIMQIIKRGVMLIGYGATASVLAIYWFPLCLYINNMAEKHRAVELENSTVKILGFDVVASFKILKSIQLVPVTTLMISFIISISTTRTTGSFISRFILLSLIIPILSFLSFMASQKVSTLLRQLSYLTRATLRTMSSWRDDERELITSRFDMQKKVRLIVEKLGPETDERFKDDVERVFPQVVMEIDKKRVENTKDMFVPIFGRTEFESNQEII